MGYYSHPPAGTNEILENEDIYTYNTYMHIYTLKKEAKKQWTLGCFRIALFSNKNKYMALRTPQGCI